LHSDVYVDGALVMAAANPPFNILTGPPATPRLLVSRGANVRQLMFNNVRWLLLDGSATTKLDTVTFNSMDPTVAQFEVQRSGTLAMPNLNNWTFTMTPTSGGYARATDTDGLAP